MKSLNVLAVAAVAALAFVGGCNKSTKSDMGAVSGQKCSEKATCSDKGACDASAKKEGAMGAVEGKKEGCCSAKKEGSMGAVNAKKEGCSSSKTCADKN